MGSKPRTGAPQGQPIGIDLGITRFATLSDGRFIEPLHSFRKHEAALRKAQQALSRKRRSSNNWTKAKLKVQRMHARIADVRRDFLHKVTTPLSQNHARVVIEDLKVSNLSKSASGTRDAPGVKVRAKSGLNKAILDQGWFEFRRQLRAGHARSACQVSDNSRQQQEPTEATSRALGPYDTR